MTPCFQPSSLWGCEEIHSVVLRPRMGVISLQQPQEAKSEAKGTEGRGRWAEEGQVPGPRPLLLSQVSASTSLLKGIFPPPTPLPRAEPPMPWHYENNPHFPQRWQTPSGMEPAGPFHGRIPHIWSGARHPAWAQKYPTGELNRCSSE